MVAHKKCVTELENRQELAAELKANEKLPADDTSVEQAITTVLELGKSTAGEGEAVVSVFGRQIPQQETDKSADESDMITTNDGRCRITYYSY